MLRALVLILLAVQAIVGQALVIATLPHGWINGGVSFMLMCGLQALAALAASLFFVAVCRRASPGYRNGLFISAFFLCMFLPVAGQVLFAIMMMAPAMFGRRRRHSDAATIQTPEYAPRLQPRGFGSASRLRAILSSPGASEQDRITAMIGMQTLAGQWGDTVIRGFMSDPVEEVRLLAYGISNATEKAVAQRIQSVIQRLQKNPPDDQKSALARTLAELHWELIYRTGVQGELRQYTLARVEHYAQMALALDSGNASMWWLLGRCALLNDDPAQAEVYFHNARAGQFPVHRVLPWLAEAAFMKREFDRIAPILTPLHHGAMTPALQPALHYWNDKA